MTEYRLVAEPRADLDVAAAYQWYLQSGIRRALIRRFPYAVYFAVETDAVVILAVLHASRNPAEWQRRRS